MRAVGVVKEAVGAAACGWGGRGLVGREKCGYRRAVRRVDRVGHNMRRCGNASASTLWAPAILCVAGVD